jgi:putative ABC transport system substrate-binding protein
MLGVSSAGLGLLAGCGRLPGQAPPAPVARLGFLGPTVPQPYYPALEQALQELGYVEGRNFHIEWRYAGGSSERLAELAAELVQARVDIIVAGGNPAIQAAKQATNTIPIVMAVASSDPVGAGLVASIAKPGGNVTGLSLHTTDLSGKRLELLKTAVPTVCRIAVLWNPTSNLLDWHATHSAAQLLDLRVISIELRGPEDFEPALAVMLAEQADALIMVPDPLLSARRSELAQFASSHRLPSMDPQREYTQVGGLMAYGPNFPAIYHRAASFVDKILKGTSAADLPIEQPMIFDFAVNLQTAQTLGISFPSEILLQVTGAIQ